MSRWRLARDLREYLAETHPIIEEGKCSVIAGGELDAWLRWCEDYAKRVDPLAQLRDEIARVKAEHPADCRSCGAHEASPSSERSPDSAAESAPPDP